ncbi:MAG: hypothetical protein ACYC6B_08750 [Thermoleophilia bacterium]
MSAPSIFRTAVVAILMTVSCLLGTVAVGVVWLHEVVVDTDRYVDTVAPLSQDPAIKDAIARIVTDDLFAQVDAGELARLLLPGDANLLADPLVGTLNGYVYGQVREQLDTPRFNSVWRGTNRRAHGLVLQTLMGKDSTLSTPDGRISLELNAVLDLVKQKLASRGILVFQNVSLSDRASRLNVMDLPGLHRAQRAIDILNKLTLWLPVLGLGLAAAAVWLARNRWWAATRLGLGLACGMVILLMMLELGRGAYLETAQRREAVDLAAATSFFDIIAASLRTFIIVTLVASLVVAALTFVAGRWSRSR